MSFSEDEYRSQFWPQLRGAVEQLLKLKSDEYTSVSFEQVYSCVYKCVCNQLSEQLLDDLRSFIRNYLHVVFSELNEVRKTDFIKRFHDRMQQFMRSLQQITTVFTYLNRVHVETKLSTSLHTLLLTDFISIVADPHIQQLIDLLLTAQLCPFMVEPSVRAQVVNDLYILKPEYASLAPHLFANYIPNILPPMCEADIPVHVQEIRFVQEKLAKEGYSRESGPLKRALDNAEAFPCVTAKENMTSF